MFCLFTANKRNQTEKYNNYQRLMPLGEAHGY